jgi:hypothetical protein
VACIRAAVRECKRKANGEQRGLKAEGHGSDYFFVVHDISLKPHSESRRAAVWMGNDWWRLKQRNSPDCCAFSAENLAG